MKRRRDGAGVFALSRSQPFGHYDLLDRVAVGGMAEIFRARDETLDLVWAEHNGQPEPLLRIRQVLAHVAPFQYIAAEEPERANLGDDRPYGEPPLFEEKQMVTLELGRSEPVEARTRVLVERLNDLDIAADGRGGVVATDELFAQALQ